MNELHPQNNTCLVLFSYTTFILVYYRRARYLAYRQFVSWCWGYLGRRNRVVIPSCGVLRIQREYPDEEGKYVSFRPPLDD